MHKHGIIINLWYTYIYQEWGKELHKLDYERPPKYRRLNISSVGAPSQVTEGEAW